MTHQTRFISRYEIQRRLGQGGMGVLYLARDPHIDRLVAVKLLHGEFADDEMRRRFVLEAKASGGLSHPNIVTVHDFGEYEGAPFIVMEYVRGDTLAAVIQRCTPISIGQRLEWMEQVCAGLTHAHGVGIIHRDIKPSNLMVDQHGRMKILDFGIARLSGTGPVMMSMVVGTPAYMSPEQIQGGMIDARSDVFSLGAVLYEILSYRPAFPGDNPHSIMHRVLNTPQAPLSPYLGDHDSSITEVVNTALAKNADDRFPSMAVFQAAIARCRITLDALGSAATSTTPIPKTAATVVPTPLSQRRPPESAPLVIPTPAPPALATPPTPASADATPRAFAIPTPAPPALAPPTPAPADPTPPAFVVPTPASLAPWSHPPVQVTPAPPVAQPAVLPLPEPVTWQPVSSRSMMAAAGVSIVLIVLALVFFRQRSSDGSDVLGSSGPVELLSATRTAAAATFVPLVGAVTMSSSVSASEEAQDDSDVSTLAARAAAAEAAGNLDGAFVQYLAVLRADRDNVEAQRGIARIRIERRNTADRLVRRANTRFEAADYDGAVADLNRALAADPGHEEATELLEKVRLARAADAKRRRVPPSEHEGHEEKHEEHEEEHEGHEEEDEGHEGEQQ